MLWVDTFTKFWAANLCCLEVFQIWFGVLLGLAMLKSLYPLCEFYKWFASSGLKMAEKRGYGQTACKFYGFVPSPNLSPSLMRLCGVVFTMLIILVAIGNLELLLNFSSLTTSRLGITTVRLLIGSFEILAIGFYHLFFSQLYCEAAVGAHVTVLIPPTLLILAMFNFHTATSSVTGAAPVPVDSDSFQAEVFFTLLIKLIMFLAYGRAGLSKIGESIKKGRNWCNGSSLQGSMFEAMWSADEKWGSRAEAERKKAVEQRKAVDKLQHQKNSGGNLGLGSAGPHLPHYSFGLPTPYSHALQRFFFRSPNLCAFSSYCGVVIEAGAPLTLLAHIDPDMVSPWLTFGFGVMGFGLHVGILYLQNVDFMSWWVPCYVFFFDPLMRIHNLAPGGVWGGPTEIRDLNSAFPSLIWNSAPAMVAAVYTLVHLTICGLLGGSIDMGILPNRLSKYSASLLPLSPFRMFCDIKDLFSPEVGKTIWLSDKPHATGTLKNYAFPFAAKEHVEEDELCQLPFKYLVIRYGGNGASTKTATTAQGTAALPAPETSKPLLQTAEKPVNVWTNLVWTADLEARLADLERLGRLGEGKWADVQCLDALLASVTQLRQAFNVAERTQPSTEAHADFRLA